MVERMVACLVLRMVDWWVVKTVEHLDVQRAVRTASMTAVVMGDWWDARKVDRSGGKTVEWLVLRKAVGWGVTMVVRLDVKMVELKVVMKDVELVGWLVSLKVGLWDAKKVAETGFQKAEQSVGKMAAYWAVMLVAKLAALTASQKADCWGE